MPEANVDVKMFFVKSWGSFRFIHDRRRERRSKKRGRAYWDRIVYLKPPRPKRKQLIHNGRKA